MARRRPQPVLASVEEHMFQAAGVSRERLAELVKRAVDKTEAQLDATLVKTFQDQGHVIYSRPLVDHATQAAAAARVFKHMLPKAGDEQTAMKVLVLPHWAYGEPEPATIEAHAYQAIDHTHDHDTPTIASGPLPWALWAHIIVDPPGGVSDVSPAPTIANGGEGGQKSKVIGRVQEPPENVAQNFQKKSDDDDGVQPDSPDIIDAYTDPDTGESLWLDEVRR